MADERPGQAKKRGGNARAPIYSSIGENLSQRPGSKAKTPHDLGEILGQGSSKRSGGAKIEKLKTLMGQG
jgi:hypothetical protein